ncbi:MAG: GNAT family N-acetyltransferase [Dehalococcoidia bacterium]
MTSDAANHLALRAATTDDAALLHRLMLAAYEEYRGTLVPASGAFDETVEDVRRAVVEGGGVVVVLDGTPVGCGRFDVDPDRAFIEVGRLSVLPAHRGRGIATRMLTWFEERAARMAIPEVRLGVRLSLPRNIALYERAGYVTYEYEYRPGFGRVAAWMRKDITMTIATSPKAALTEIVERGPAELGLTVRHIEREEQVDLDGDTPYPAASVFKVPVLVEAFRQIERGALSLSDRWELTEEDKSTGSGVLTRLMPGLQPTVRDLLTLMIIISDNTATDMLVRRLDPARITATMRELGYHNTVVARGCRDLLHAILGDASPALSPHEMARHLVSHPVDPDSPAYAGADDNNISTANEMADLFARIHTGAGLADLGIGDDARRMMREILLLQQLNDRMPRYLPPGVPVAHKTGSLGGPWAIRNDAGLIDLGDRGTVSLAIFTRTRMPVDADPRRTNQLLTSIDEEIALLTRTVFDYYMG